MLTQPRLAERLAFGRLLDPETDTARHVAPRPITALAGRILLSAIFLLAGASKLMDLDGTANAIAAHGLPSPMALAVIAAVAEILGGLSLLLGFLARLGAIGLILYLIPTTLVFHAFWTVSGAEQQMQMSHFSKNLAIFGGLMLIVAFGPGRYSVDARLRTPA